MANSTLPLVNSTDVAWIVFRDFETLGEVFVTSLTSNAVVKLQSGPTLDESQLDGTVTTLTFGQAGLTQRVALPVVGGRINRVTKLYVTSGQVKVVANSPTEMNMYLIYSPDLTSFGPTS